MSKRKPVRNVPPVLDRLRKVTQQRAELRQRQVDLIAEARSAGHTWADIGPALGTTPEAARTLYIRITGDGPEPRPRLKKGESPTRDESFYRNLRRLSQRRSIVQRDESV